MDLKEIAKQYKENKVQVLSILEGLVKQFKQEKTSLDIQQLQLVTEYLIWDRENDEDYIDELEKEIEKKDNTIVSKDKEIKFLEELYDKHIKIINEMAENIYENDSIFYLPKEINSKETVIAYFTNLVQEGDK